MVLIDRLDFPWIAIGLLVPAVALGLVTRTWHGFWSGLIWGGLVRVALTRDVGCSANSVCHIW